MTERDDAEMLRAWAAGDRAAGDVLVRRHFTAVYRFVRRRLVDPAATKDLAQRTFLVCVEQHARLDAGVSFRAWAMGVARNLLLHQVRDQARAERLGARLVPEISVISPSGAAAAHQERALLLGAMQGLPADLRVTIELHYWEDLSTAEIATVLGIASGTVKWRLSRARALLRERIADAPAPALARETTLRRLEQWTGRLDDDDETGAAG